MTLHFSLSFVLFIQYNLIPALVSLAQRTCSFLEPILEFLAVYIGGRVRFGRLLATLVVVYLFILIAILHICIIPRRFFILHHTIPILGSQDTQEVYQWWIGFHLILSHWLLVNIVFHYFSAIFTSPGRVPLNLCNDTSGRVNVPLSLEGGYCYRCCSPRPSRSHHCSVCNVCVMRMDHHCPWIANCVGLNTHRHFYLALIYMVIGGSYLVTVGRWDFNEHLEEISRLDIGSSSMTGAPANSTFFIHFSLKSSPSIGLHNLFTFCLRSTIIALPLAAGLCGWQTFLITRGETNIEYHINRQLTESFRSKGLVYHNPYDLGPLGNWARFLGLFEYPSGKKDDDNNRPVSFRYSKWSLLLRICLRVLLPRRRLVYGTGFHYEKCIPSNPLVLEALQEIELSHQNELCQNYPPV